MQFATPRRTDYLIDLSAQSGVVILRNQQPDSGQPALEPKQVEARPFGSNLRPKRWHQSYANGGLRSGARIGACEFTGAKRCRSIDKPNNDAPSGHSQVKPELGDGTVVRLGRPRHRRGESTVNRTASENTAPVPFESAYAIWTSWQHSCDRDDQALMQRGDRVGNVTLGPDRRRRGVGNYREWQVF